MAKPWNSVIISAKFAKKINTTMDNLKRHLKIHNKDREKTSNKNSFYTFEVN